MLHERLAVRGSEPSAIRDKRRSTAGHTCSWGTGLGRGAGRGAGKGAGDQKPAPASASAGNRSPEGTSTGPWDNPALAKFREWDPLWVEQCLKMSGDPWTNGVLPRKDVELISLAVNAACTNLSAEGTRRHIRGALEAGASRDEILMILKIASLLSIHTCSLGAPILLEEAKAPV